MLFAGADVHIEHHAQAPDKQTVIHMARAAALVGVVAHLRPFLVAVDGFHRRVQVHDPRVPEGGQIGLAQGLGVPGRHGDRIGVGEGAADAVFAAHLVHAQAGRVDPVGPQRGNMAVALVTGQHRQHDGAQQIGVGGRVVAAKLERARLHPVMESSGRGQELAEENHPPQRRDRGCRIPLDVVAAPVGVHGQRRVEHGVRGRAAGIDHLTRRVRFQRGYL